MKKDAYYFPHFSNARNDAKIIKLRRVLGLEGYAIYFMLLEVLREQTEFKYPLAGIEDLSFEWHVSREKIQSVIGQFDLFQIDENNFFSTKLVLYLQPYLEKSARASVAANKRWESVKNQLDQHIEIDANAMQMHSKSNTNADASKVKNSKVKNSKVKPEKQIFGINQNIYLSIDETEKLKVQLNSNFDKTINFLSSYKIEKNYKTESDYLTILRWVIDAVNKQTIPSHKSSVFINIDPSKDGSYQ